MILFSGPPSHVNWPDYNMCQLLNVADPMLTCQYSEVQLQQSPKFNNRHYDTAHMKFELLI